MKGNLYVISGPAGAGKGTVIGWIMRKDPRCVFSVSVTTRDPRPGEEEGVSYYFITQQRFDELKGSGDLLEYAEVHGHCYGTPRSYIEERLTEGKNVILDIDVQGALNVKKNMPEACLVFVTPPSYAVLEERLRGRNTESTEEIERRLKNALAEYEQAHHYDYLLINDDAEDAAKRLKKIMEVSRMEMGRNTDKIEKLLKGERI